MTNGRCRVTVVDPQGRAYVQDVGPGDIWYAPAGYPHSLQGLGPDGWNSSLPSTRAINRNTTRSF